MLHRCFSFNLYGKNVFLLYLAYSFPYLFFTAIYKFIIKIEGEEAARIYT